MCSMKETRYSSNVYKLVRTPFLSLRATLPLAIQNFCCILTFGCGITGLLRLVPGSSESYRYSFPTQFQVTLCGLGELLLWLPLVSLLIIFMQLDAGTRVHGSATCEKMRRCCKRYCFMVVQCTIHLLPIFDRIHASMYLYLMFSFSSFLYPSLPSLYS